MSNFKQKLDDFLDSLGLTLYQVSLSVGEDPSRIDKILYMKRGTTFDKRLETLGLIADSPLLKGKIDLGVMAAWLAEDYITPDALQRLMQKAEAARKSKG